ncbi:MAG: alpha/beta hydrolase [Pseudonocardia sp.]|jgi:pimeloyl-[acyl-carrier protein] methyl ester esterase|uniref:alpha/beta fold hydrolase n=1 Tax=Pseudonocardia sp. TaxID=60912 RepID=UPI00260D17BD|nr:alpha/beta hydrolase [Pseudonocardia sp.]MCU1630947.1 alpha/beta hydrolase [Pseudonocardia sp.]
MAFLDVENGKQVYYEHHRGGGGRPVVLVHGWGATTQCWDTTLTALLKAGHEVALIDHRACGRSDKDFDDVSIEAIASDVVALVRHLGLREPVLDGWSLGGAIVAAAAAELGDDIRGLVLTGGATPRYTQTEGWPYGGTAADVEGILAGLEADRPTTFRGIAGAVCAKPVGDDVVEGFWLQFMQTGTRSTETMRSLIALDQRDLIGTIRCPVLSLHGTEDAFVAFDGAKAAIPLFHDARLVEFPGVGHAPFVEDAETYLSELLAFVR